MVRSSILYTGAASAPARKSFSRADASAEVSPVTWKRFLNTPWIAAVLMISSVLTRRVSVRSPICTVSSRHSMNSVDIGRPRLFWVVSSMFSPPAESSVMNTAGWPSALKPAAASTICSPEAMTSRLRT